MVEERKRERMGEWKNGRMKEWENERMGDRQNKRVAEKKEWEKHRERRNMKIKRQRTRLSV